MTSIVGQLADLTSLRDRQSLVIALATTLHDLLQPSQVLIVRRVGPPDNERWLTSASLINGLAQTSDASAWADLDELPSADQFPVRQQVLAQRLPIVAQSANQASVFPLISATGTAAVLELWCAQPLAADQLRLIDGVLRLFLNFQDLLDYGERDALTELLNRKTFDGAFLKATVAVEPLADSVLDNDRRQTTADAEVSAAGASYWLAMLDIDHFKRVNDNFGHLIGDEVLLLLARLMRQTFRIHDQLYRFGGEEFLVLMRCPQAEQARNALERLRTGTESHRFPQVGQITVSIGFTQVRHGDSPSNAIERADKAVYYAKEHGRNQVCGFEELMAQGKLAVEPDNVGDIELF